MLKTHQKSAFLTGAPSGIGKAAPEVALVRRPRALCDEILCSQVAPA